MGSINVRGDKLYIDFRYCNVRCREQTLLNNTTANQRKLTKLLNQIDADIRLGCFVYSEYFPESNLAARFVKQDIQARHKKEELLGAYDRIPGERKNRVILHFSETRYINSSGIAILIGVINRANEVKGRVEFAGLSPHFRKVMDIVGLTDFVKVYDSLQDALQASSANQS